MTIIASVLLLMLIGATAYLVVPYLLRAYSRFRGSRVVICPETDTQAIVEVDAGHAALTSVFTKPDIRLENCSRWPIKRDCGQECLAKLEGIEPECLVQGVLMKWYRGRKCVYCGKEFSDLHWIDHKPALQSAEGTLLDWSQVKLSELEKATATGLPVCWDCYIAQTFRLEHPDLVVYRPWINERRSGAGR